MKRVWGWIKENSGSILLMIFVGYIRFSAIKWGLPNEHHNFSYHPDEFLTALPAYKMIANSDWNPHIYNYPSLYYYLTSFVGTLALGFGVKPTLTNIYLFPRIVTAILSIVSLPAIYWAARQYFNKISAGMAAFLLFLTPVIVLHSRFATVDVPSMFFVIISVGFAGKAYKEGNTKYFIWAGVFAGLAAGTRYQAGFVILSTIAAGLMLSKTLLKDKLLKISLAVLATVIVFIITTPGVILDYQHFITAIKYEMNHAKIGHGLVFAGTGNGLLYILTNNLRFALGWVIYLSFAIALYVSYRKKERQVLVLLAFIMPYIILISFSQVRFVRYLIPIIPAILIITSSILIDTRKEFSFRNIFVTVILSFLFVMPSMDLFISITRKDIHEYRDSSAEHIINLEIPLKGIAVMDVPWFYSIPLSKDIGFGSLPERREALKESKIPIKVMLDYNKPEDWFKNNKPDLVIVSDYEISDAYRLRNNNNISSEDRAQVSKILANMDFVQKNYRLDDQYKKLYEYESSKMDFVTYTLFGSPAKDIPHDMKYTLPTIYIYKLKK